MGCGGSKESDETKMSPAPLKEDPKPTKSPTRPDDVNPEVKPAGQDAAKPAAGPRRAGVSAETGDQEEAMATRGESKIVKVEKTPEQQAMINEATGGSALFTALSPAQKQEVIDAMQEEKREAGDVVIQQGDKGNYFYVVATGEYGVYLNKVENGTKCVKTYQTGETFGELALMYNTPRAATVKCSASGSLFSLDRATFRAILMAANKENLDSTASFLKSISLFSDLTDPQRDTLSNVLEECSFGPRETICREGDVADSLYLVREGELVAYKAAEGKELGVELGRMGVQMVFGESALQGSAETEKRQATVVAATKVTLLKLTRDNFKELFGDLAEVIKFNFNQKVLGAISFFKELTESEKSVLIESLEEEAFETGVDIIRQGTQGDSFYIIKTGSVKVWNEVGGKENVVKDKLGPSDYFGEMALLNDEPRGASVTSTSSTVCMKLDRKTFRKLLGENIAHEIIEREAARRKAELERKQRPPIRMQDLKTLAILGVGTFGRVKLCLHGSEQTPYALKCMRKGQVIALKQVEHVMNEKNLLEICDHPFLLRLAATFQDDNEIYMLLELALGGELFSELRAKVKFEEKQSCFYAACVGAAFAYMHDLQIVYRDLKPENLLFDSVGYLKVVDFGFAKLITDRTWTLCGTPEYLAPEIITNKGHNLAVDWWAFGILIFEMLTGQPPFCADDPMDIYQKILRNRFTYPAFVSKSARDLISKLLVTNPAQRLGSLKKGPRDVTGHAFFKPIDFNALYKRTIPAPFKPKISSPTDTSNFDDYEEDEKEAGEWSRYNDKRKDTFKGF